MKKIEYTLFLKNLMAECVAGGGSVILTFERGDLFSFFSLLFGHRETMATPFANTLRADYFSTFFLRLFLAYKSQSWSVGSPSR